MSKSVRAVRTGFLIIALLIVSERGSAARAEIKSFKTAAPLYQAPRKSLYGIGQAQANAGTIIIVNGNIHTAAAVNEKKIQIDDSMKTVASSLTYVNVGVWSDIPITMPIKTQSDLDPLINSTLKKIGYELPGVFPFLLKGKFSSIEFKLGAQDKAFKFSDRGISGIVVGIFTRKASADGATFDSSSVMHFISDDRKRAGVVESYTIDAKGGVSLFLPR